MPREDQQPAALSLANHELGREHEREVVKADLATPVLRLLARVWAKGDSYKLAVVAARRLSSSRVTADVIRISTGISPRQQRRWLRDFDRSLKTAANQEALSDGDLRRVLGFTDAREQEYAA